MNIICILIWYICILSVSNVCNGNTSLTHRGRGIKDSKGGRKLSTMMKMATLLKSSLPWSQEITQPSGKSSSRPLIVSNGMSKRTQDSPTGSSKGGPSDDGSDDSPKSSSKGGSSKGGPKGVSSEGGSSDSPTISPSSSSKGGPSKGGSKGGPSKGGLKGRSSEGGSSKGGPKPSMQPSSQPSISSQPTMLDTQPSSQPTSVPSAYWQLIPISLGICEKFAVKVIYS
jgi:hypothetical protein